MLGKEADYRSPNRQEWFGCACCPPNVARLIASLARYIYSTTAKDLYVHLYVGGSAECTIRGRKVQVVQETEYPWKDKIRLRVNPASPAEFGLALRIPGWARTFRVNVNGKSVKLAPKKGYVHIVRTWKKGDRVDLVLPMAVERIEAHPAVRQDAGFVALQRGPIVYCLEEADNGPEPGGYCPAAVE